MDVTLKDRVLDAVDIVDVVGEHVRLQRKGREFLGLCPFHNDNNPSMAVSPAKQIFKCWSCGVGGDVFKFVQLLHRVEFREALQMLAERAGVSVSQEPQDEARAQRREQLRAAMEWAQRHFRRNLERTSGGRSAAEYARSRGLGAQWIEKLQLGYAADGWDDLLRAAQQAGLSPDLLQAAGLVTTNERGRTYDRFRHRLIFPIFDAMGRCVAFGGRTLGDDPAKYLNSPETPLFSKSRVLYGLNFARDAVRSKRHAVVVEGYFDAALLYEAGIEEAVATLGVALTDSHLKALTPLVDRLYFCFDSDEAGTRAADRAAETALQRRMAVRVVTIPGDKDPADFVQHHGREEFNNLLQSSVGALEFKWNQTLRAFQARGDFARRDAAAAFLHFVAQGSAAGGINVLEQGLMVSRLSELLSVPAEQVYRMLAEQRAGRHASRPEPDAPPVASGAYARSLRSLPAGFVGAVEALFGLALAEPQRFSDVYDSLAAAAVYNRWWEALVDLIESAEESAAGSDWGAVVLAQAEGEILDVISRAERAWPKHRVVREEDVSSLRRRIAFELQNQRQEQLAEQLRDRADASRAERAFEALVRVAKQQSGAGSNPALLSAQQRWRALAESAARESDAREEEY